MQQPKLSLKARALRLLAGREHSRLELQRKLSKHEEQAGELSALLDALQALGFISEERVADSVVHQKASRFGLQRVKAELHSKGLAPDVVENALAGLRDTELQRAHAVWQKKFGAAATTPQERAKHMRFLAARGFSSGVIHRALSLPEDTDFEQEL